MDFLEIFNANFLGVLVSESVDSAAEDGFVGEHTRDLTLVLRGSLSDERSLARMSKGTEKTYVIDKTVFRGGLFSLQSSEESFLGSQNLYGGCRVLSQVDEGSRG